MKKLLAFGMVACVLAYTVALPAQSLGEVAKREEERRKTVKTPGKTYTNGSLRANPASRGRTEPAAAVPPAPAPAPAVGEAAAAAPKRDESYWTKRIAAERDALARARTFAEAMQSRINALANDFASRDDPAQRSVIAADRQRSLAELDRLRSEIQQHSNGITDIQEEARRAGVPPGWVR